MQFAVMSLFRPPAQARPRLSIRTAAPMIAVPSKWQTGDAAGEAPECAAFGGMPAGAFGEGDGDVDGDTGLAPGCVPAPLPGVPGPAPEPGLLPVLVAGDGPPAHHADSLSCQTQRC